MIKLKGEEAKIWGERNSKRATNGGRTFQRKKEKERERERRKERE